MEMYAFSVRCEPKFTIIQINDCSGKKEENHEKSVGGMAGFQCDMRNWNVQNIKQECRN